MCGMNGQRQVSFGLTGQFSPEKLAERYQAKLMDHLIPNLDEFVVDGIDTTLPLFRDLVHEPDIISGDYDIHWLEKWAAARKAQA